MEYGSNSSQIMFLRGCLIAICVSSSQASTEERPLLPTLAASSTSSAFLTRNSHLNQETKLKNKALC